MRYARYGLIAVLLSIFFLPLNASAANLLELILFSDQGASITAGDKRFTNFSGSLMSGGANPQLLDQIEVEGFSVGDTHGLSFFVPFNPSEPPPSGFAGFGSVNLGVGFDVTATGGHNAITGIAVGLSSVFLINASAFLTAGGASVSASGNFDGPLSSDVFAFSTPATSVHVEAGLFLVTDEPTLDNFFQAFGYNVSFFQSESVPEPSPVLLLVFGGGVIAAIAHKIRQA